MHILLKANHLAKENLGSNQKVEEVVEGLHLVGVVEVIRPLEVVEEELESRLEEVEVVEVLKQPRL